jgi:hypothetical protein
MEMNKEIILNRKHARDEKPQIPSVYSSPSKKFKTNIPAETVDQNLFKGVLFLSCGSGLLN